MNQGNSWMYHPYQGGPLWEIPITPCIICKGPSESPLEPSFPVYSIARFEDYEVIANVWFLYIYMYYYTISYRHSYIYIIYIIYIIYTYSEEQSSHLINVFVGTQCENENLKTTFHLENPQKVLSSWDFCPWGWLHTECPKAKEH